MQRRTKFAAGALVAAMTLIGGFEGYRQLTYYDPYGGIDTACFGSTEGVESGREYRPEECAALLARDVIEASRVLECIDVPLTENQQTALTSWAYNVGVSAACGSTLVRQANAGRPASEWCHQLDRWVYSGGVKLRGLERRRAEERELCLGGADGAS